MYEDFLKQILDSKREELKLLKVQKPLSEAEIKPLQTGLFRKAIEQPGIALIAEIKKASPSKGPLNTDIVPADLAGIYEKSGASAISVLTERQFFYGCLDDLSQVRQSCCLPVLRKDFIIDSYQILETAAVGAGAVLLIVAALDQSHLRDLLICATNFGLDALVEVHDVKELETAQKADAAIIGINNRDLQTFRVDLHTTYDLLPEVDKHRLVVAESGIRSSYDVSTLEEAGVQAVLVGETLVTAEDPASKIRELMDYA